MKKNRLKAATPLHDAFSWGRARPLYRAGTHPRLMFDAARLEEVASHVRRGAAGPLVRTLRADAQRMADHVLNDGDWLATLTGWSDWYDMTCRVVTGLDDLALIAVLDAKARPNEAARARDAVVKVLSSLPAAERAGNRALWHCGAMIRVPLAFDLVAETLPEGFRREFSAWAVERCIEPSMSRLDVAVFQYGGKNMTLSEACQAAMFVLAVEGEPGVPDLSARRARCVQYLEAIVNSAIGVDGYPMEDIGYGTSFIGSHIAPLAEVMRRAGDFDVYRACPRYAKVGEAVMHFVRPWGASLLNTGDHSGDFLHRHFMLLRLADETGDPTLRWLAGTLGTQFYRLVSEAHPGGDSGKKQAEDSLPADAFLLAVVEAASKTGRRPAASATTHFCDRDRGIVSFRSGWQADAALLVFDGGNRSPAVPGHSHASAGHFDFVALGEDFAIDTGRYCIEQDQHNVVLVDGHSGRSTQGKWKQSDHAGVLSDHAPGPMVDYAAADLSGASDCYWARRHVGLVKGRGVIPYVWMVDDVNKDNQWHTFWWAVNTHPDNRITLGRESATIHGNRRGARSARLNVFAVLPGAKEYARPHALDWSQDVARSGSVEYVGDVTEAAGKFASPGDMIHRTVHLRPRLLAKVSGYNGRFMTLLIPARHGESGAKVERLESLPGSLAARVSFSGVSDTVIFAFEHGMLEAGDVSRRGRWCVVRQSTRSGRVLAETVR